MTENTTTTTTTTTTPLNKGQPATIVILPGYTGKDHLLPEIADRARASLRPGGYASKFSARRAAWRAVVRVIASRPLYAGCGAGFFVI